MAVFDNFNRPSRKAQYVLQGERRSRGIVIKKSKRRCRVCGKDPAPNRFFCKGCHPLVSAAFAPLASETY